MVKRLLCGGIFEKQTTVLMMRASSSISDPEMTEWYVWTRHIDNMARHTVSRQEWAILRDAGTSRCSDSRDKAYGNLSFLRDTERGIDIQPDYTLSVSDVNIKLVLKFHKCLNILRCCELSDEPENLPTWTPNWKIGTILFESSNSDARAPAEASYGGNGVLGVEGKLTAVLVTTEVYQESEYLNDICSEIYRMAPQIVSEECSRGGGNLLDSFCRSLVGGSLRERRPDAKHYPTWQNSTNTLLELLRSNGKSKISYY